MENKKQTLIKKEEQLNKEFKKLFRELKKEGYVRQELFSELQIILSGIVLLFFVNVFFMCNFVAYNPAYNLEMPKSVMSMFYAYFILILFNLKCSPGLFSTDLGKNYSGYLLNTYFLSIYYFFFFDKTVMQEFEAVQALLLLIPVVAIIAFINEVVLWYTLSFVTKGGRIEMGFNWETLVAYRATSFVFTKKRYIICNIVPFLLYFVFATIVHFTNNIYLFIFSQLLTFTAANGLYIALRLLFYREKGAETLCLQNPYGGRPVVLVKHNNQ